MPLAITYLPLDNLHPADRNPRTHSPAQIKAIERSLAKFGWATPIGLASGKLIYGHARRQAALNMRARNEPIRWNDDPDLAPTVDLSHMGEDDRRAYVIADNQLALLAGWDEAALGAELRELAQSAYDLSVLGFAKADLSDLMIERVGEDRAGAMLELAQVTIGEPRHKVEPYDHWLLSERHHLLCCSVIEDWPTWRPLLQRGSLFVPYPGPFVPFGRKAAFHDLVMVQPDAYAAGHLLDRYAEQRGEDAVHKAPAT